MTDLPAYSGPNPTCPKCGHDQADTEHRGAGERFLGRTGDENIFAVTADDAPEYLLRQCLGCWYSWAEAVRC